MSDKLNNSTQTPKPTLSRFSIIAGVILLFILGSYFLRDVPLGEGEEAPLFDLPLANGSEGVFSMEARKGKPVLLDFWSTSCPPCLMQIPILQRIHAEFPDVQVVGVAVGGETLAQLKSFASKRSIQYPIVADLKGVAANPYNVSSLPTLFMVGEDGLIIESHQGLWPEDELLATIRKALKR